MKRATHASGLSKEWVQRYHEIGYIFPDDRILSDEEIGAVIDLAEQVKRGETAFLPFMIQLENSKSLEEEQPTEANPVRKLTGLSYQLPAIEKLARDPRIVDKVESILGPDIKLYTDEFFFKNPAREGKAYASYRWHQDAPGYPFFAPPDHVVTCWIALDRATVENGCMQFIPRSHVYGAIPGGRYQAFMKNPNLAKPEFAPVEPGHCVMHHGLNFHSSDQNKSNKPRRSLAFHYMRADTLYLGVEEEWIRRIVQIGEMGEGYRFMRIRGRELAGCV